MKKRRTATSALDHFETASTGHHCPKDRMVVTQVE